MPWYNRTVMTTLSVPNLLRPEQARPLELHSGDRMTREEFHRIYEQMPEHFKAELIGGVVYVASPARLPHGTTTVLVGGVLFIYSGSTPRIEVADNATVILGEDAEPQPDLFVRILPAYGGQSSTTAKEYVKGAPELVTEIAHSTRAIDLNAKKQDYARFGVREYLVICPSDAEVHWFDLAQSQDPLKADADGVIRSRTFPGLWIDGIALLSKDAAKLIAVAQQGIATPEHAKFVEQLEAARAARAGQQS
jgi:hypothetical protein